MTNLSKDLAENLIQLRKKRRFSQEDLAQISSIPRSTIAHIESGSGNPSLRNLISLSQALQISVEELLQSVRPPVLHVQAAQIRSQTKSQGSAILFKLLPDAIPGMEIDRLEIQKGGRVGGVPHLPSTKEYFTCIRGEVTIGVSGDKYVLREGDVLAFPGDQPHAYVNSGSEKMIGISVVVLGR